jgi:hypothetical protein
MITILAVVPIRGKRGCVEWDKGLPMFHVKHSRCEEFP